MVLPWRYMPSSFAAPTDVAAQDPNPNPPTQNQDNDNTGLSPTAAVLQCVSTRG